MSILKDEEIQDELGKLAEDATYMNGLRVTAKAQEKKTREEMVDTLGLFENDLGFCEISNHVPYPPWRMPE